MIRCKIKMWENRFMFLNKLRTYETIKKKYVLGKKDRESLRPSIRR